MTPIFMKLLPDMIAIVLRNFCSIDRQIDCISQQVWVSGYKPQWNNQMTPIFIKILPDTIAIDVIYVVLTARLIGSTISRYEFQDTNHTGIIKWRLYLWSTTRYDCHWCNMNLKYYGPSINCIHSQQVWVSGYQPQRNNKMTPIFMEALPD